MNRYFSRYGEVEDCYIAKRKNGKSSGYGYVVATSEKMYRDILAIEHKLNDRDFITVPFQSRERVETDQNRYKCRKVVISKVPHKLTLEDLYQFFG